MKIKGKRALLTCLVILVLFLTSNQFGGKGFQLAQFNNSQSGFLSAIPSTWSYTELVSTESNDESSSPSITEDSTGNVHLVWRDKTDYDGADVDYDIFYKMWDITTNSWGEIVVLSPESTLNCMWPSIVADSSNNLHVIWSDNSDIFGAGSDEDVFYKMWNASNSSWFTTQVVSENTISSDCPSIGVDSTGKIHIVWREYSASRIAYRYWDSSSSSWSATKFISTESTSTIGAPSLAIDNFDNLHFVWPDESDIAGSGTDSDIVYKWYNSSLNWWSGTQVVSTESTADCWSSSLTTDNSGNVHVVWKDYTELPSAQSPYWSIAYKRWNSSSRSWSSTEVVNKESTRYSDAPCIVADSSNNLNVAWFEYGYISFTDILYNYWNSSSLSWGNTKELTTETYFSESFMLAIGLSDNLHLAWKDYSSFGSSGSDADIYYKNQIVDSDMDGMLDSWEQDNGLNSTIDDSLEDLDGDGLTNIEEYQNNSNPQVIDSDGDGLNDYEEVIIYGTSPTSTDSDGDGYSDKQEVDEETDPLDPDDYPIDDNTVVVSFLPIFSIMALVKMGIKRRKGKSLK